MKRSLCNYGLPNIQPPSQLAKFRLKRPRLCFSNYPGLLLIQQTQLATLEVDLQAAYTIPKKVLGRLCIQLMPDYILPSLSLSDLSARRDCQKQTQYSTLVNMRAEVQDQEHAYSLIAPDYISPLPLPACLSQYRDYLDFRLLRVLIYALAQVPPYSLIAPEYIFSPPLLACLN